jgi:DNA polymerase (family 10)
VDNAAIADRLEAFASLLELADANPYTIRAYRRGAELIRGVGVPVEGLVRSGRVRELRGVGPGIEARLRELVETGQIAELADLERELAPGLVGLGRYLGLTAKRSVELARALEVRTPDEFREAAAAGRLRAVPGVGPKLELQILDALQREGEPRPPRGITLPRARELGGRIAEALGGEMAGDPRRWRDSCERLAVVCAERDPGPLLERFAALPQIVALIEQGEGRAVGPPRKTCTPRSACRGARRSCARRRSAASRRRSSSSSGSAATCTATPRGPTAGRAWRRWAARRATAATSTWRSATTRPRWARCRA